MTTLTQRRARRGGAQRRGMVAVATVSSVLAVAILVATPASGSVPPSSSVPASSATATIAPPTSIPEELEQLAGGLLNTAILGVPEEWAIRDIDQSIADDVAQFADTDPFLGLLQCPAGTIREGSDRLWLARRYTAPELPLENGMLSIEIIVEVESATEWQDDREALDDCTVGEYASLATDSTTVPYPRPANVTASTGLSETTEAAVGSVDGQPLDAATVELLSLPTAAVAYPSAFNATSVNAGDRTVTVVVGGVDMGQSWQHVADQIVAVALEGLGVVPPPS
jgi:hypothetical protein